MSGREAVARPRGPGLGAAGVFMSAGLRTAQEAARLGTDGARAKPFDFDDLVALVARYRD